MARHDALWRVVHGGSFIHWERHECDSGRDAAVALFSVGAALLGGCLAGAAAYKYNSKSSYSSSHSLSYDSLFADGDDDILVRDDFEQVIEKLRDQEESTKKQMKKIRRAIQEVAASYQECSSALQSMRRTCISTLEYARTSATIDIVTKYIEEPVKRLRVAREGSNLEVEKLRSLAGDVTEAIRMLFPKSKKDRDAPMPNWLIEDTLDACTFLSATRHFLADCYNASAIEQNTSPFFALDIDGEPVAEQYRMLQREWNERVEQYRNPPPFEPKVKLAPKQATQLTPSPDASHLLRIVAQAGAWILKAGKKLLHATSRGEVLRTLLSPRASLPVPTEAQAPQKSTPVLILENAEGVQDAYRRLSEKKHPRTRVALRLLFEARQTAALLEQTSPSGGSAPRNTLISPFPPDVLFGDFKPAKEQTDVFPKAGRIVFLRPLASQLGHPSREPQYPRRRARHG